MPGIRAAVRAGLVSCKHCIAFFLLAASPVALARIGESPAQCAARYGEATPGEPNEDGLPRIEYNKGPMTVVVAFENNKAVSLDYMRKDKDGKVLPFSRDEIIGFLSAHGPERDWKVDKSANIVEFINERKSLHGATSNDGRGLSVWLLVSPPPEAVRARWRSLEGLDGF